MRAVELGPGRYQPPSAGEIQVMGILNVTPDSFSDGGRFTSEQAIQRQLEQLLAAGADLIDIGGESTRPFAEAVAEQEELRRVLPAIRMVRRLSRTVPVSIDTTKAGVARAALEAGADIINDVSGLRFDPAMVEVARVYKAPVIIMHMQGTPRDMQRKPAYGQVVEELLAFFRERLQWAEAQGLERRRLIIDPGIGFGKNLEHNLSILKHLDRFTVFGCPVLVGHSRKSFLGQILGLKEPTARDQATAVVAALCAERGGSILRVHDVAATRQAVQLVQAIGAAP